MLRIAVCDDDLKFTGDFETLVLQESRNMGIRVETDVFSDGDTLVKSILSGERYNLIFLANSRILELIFVATYCITS